MLNRRSIVTLIVATCGAAAVPASGQDFLNSTWETQYTSGGGDEVDSIVTLTASEENPDEAEGSYESSIQGEPVGGGTLTKVRLKPGKRDGTPLPGPGQENLGGLPPLQTLYLSGEWTFENKRGWFKWQLYESGGECKFRGDWGYVQNGKRARPSGQWSGTLQPTDPSNGIDESGGAVDGTEIEEGVEVDEGFVEEEVEG